MSSSTISSRKRRANSHDFTNSSDTEPSPSKRRCRNWPRSLATGVALTPRKSIQHLNLDLEEILRRCVVEPLDHSWLCELQYIKREDGPPLYAIKKIIRSVKLAVKEVVDDSEKLLETELYSSWLKGFQPVLNAIQGILNAKVPSTRRRVPGLGWISFAILYYLIDEFISEVNAHQDGWSHRSMGLGPSDYPPTMSLAEECKDPSADIRSEKAVATADALLKQYDTVMLMAVQRYKAENGKTKRVACSIGRRENALASACCLLSEQTGYGSDGAAGNVLLKRTRAFMRKWRSEYGSDEQENYTDSDDYRE
ncbi:hypothetical protein AX17_005199 [Amanita inopinata Kibby_2008]|nr:hypothetical protein AX17_005199 [Amanita inopinata Kibby_2008]